MSTTRQILRPIPLRDITIDDPFWSPRIETNRRRTIPHAYMLCKQSGRIDAFKLSWKPGRPMQPHYFWDSDVAKWVEAAAYCLATRQDKVVRRKLNRVVSLIAGAQQPDGYLNVYFTVVEPHNRWTNLRDRHELYCAGHLIEAGVAHFEATESRTLINVVRRYADHIALTFGPGKRTGYPGHEEIELALIKLYRVTGERRYLKLASYFIDERGRRPHFYDREARSRGEDPADWEWDYTKNQSHLPVRRQREAVGHAVRAMYLYSAMADVAAEMRDASLLTACKRMWRSVTRRKMYLTGGVGAVRRGEAFGPDYFLPSQDAYAETCAACGLLFFAHRMLQLDLDRDYADVMERVLYNGLLGGVGLNGKEFFYENPLASAGCHHRKEWFDCACCPPNLARVLASLGRYAYSSDRRGIYVHLFIAGRARIQVGPRRVVLKQITRYPWDGFIRLQVMPSAPASFDLMIRLPGWCRRFELRVNDKATRAGCVRGYLRLHRRWRRGDTIDLTLEMPIRCIKPHPKVTDLTGRVALGRGPIVYCFEGCDHGGDDVRQITLPALDILMARFDSKLLGGAVVIESADDTRIRAIPYALWDNRQSGTMTVWVKRRT